MEGEFWLGNDNIHALTTQAGTTYALRIELDDGNETRIAAYDSFYIAGPEDNYRLQLGAYLTISNAGERNVDFVLNIVAICPSQLHFPVTTLVMTHSQCIHVPSVRTWIPLSNQNYSCLSNT